MSEQFGRRVQFVFADSGGNTVVIENLRIDFDIKKSLSSEPNTCKIEIYNLSQSTRQKMGTRGAKFALFAGYGEQIGLIFRGFIRNVNTVKESTADIITSVYGGDGDKVFSRSTIFTTLPKNSTTDDAVNAISGNLEDATKGKNDTVTKKYKRPLVLAGQSKAELNKTVRANGGTWSIQDGELELLKQDTAINDVILINESTGMVGVPIVTEKGVEVEALLNPRVKPGRVMKVESTFSEVQNSELNFEKTDTDLGAGNFKIETVVFKGSNLSNDFYMKATGVRFGR